MFFKILYIFIFIIILFLIFFLISKKKLYVRENFSNVSIYENIYITNTINDNIICIEADGLDGIYISMTSSIVGSSPTYYSVFRMHLNGSDDVVDIQCANGNYWYYNYRAGSYGPLGNGSGSNVKSRGPIDLSTVPSTSIFENALLFENGSMITFDITGTHMIISSVPTATSPQKAQCIFALGTHDTTNLAGNTMTLLNIVGNQTPPANYYYYNGQTGTNTDGTDPSNGVVINPFETTAIFVPNNNRQGILQFTNGCFIDGTSTTFPNGEQALRFVGCHGVVNFNLNNTYDMFQIWNPLLSSYFYYNYSNSSGTTSVQYSIYSSKSNTFNMSYKTIANLNPVNLLPYTPAIGNTINSDKTITYNFVDQVLIYNPKSSNNYAILLQVDTCLWGQNVNNMTQGTNNYSLTLSSVMYNPTNQSISSNPNAISKFYFNFNNPRGDLIEFVINNGKTSTNTTRYFCYNGYSNNFGNLSSKGVSQSNSGSLGIAGTTFSVMPNNLPWNTSTPTNLTTSTSSVYGFRNTTPNLVVFENTICFADNLKIGIDSNGNCIWKGSTGQIEFNIVKQNMDSNINMFGLNSDGSINYQVNNWKYNGTDAGHPIGQGITSGTVHHITSWGNCGISSQQTTVISATTGNFIVSSATINQPLNSSTPSEWPCENVTQLNPSVNKLLLNFGNGYTDSNSNTLNPGSVCVVEPDYTPLKLVSDNQTSNVVNGSTVNNVVKQIQFSNGMNLQGGISSGRLMIQGTNGSFFSQLNSSNASYTATKGSSTFPVFVQIQNNTIRASGSNRNWTLGYGGGNGFNGTAITSNTVGYTFS